MERSGINQILHWMDRPDRKPLILRGARQVGKTWLVREAAMRSGRRLVELNFERTPLIEKCFASNDPGKILAELSLSLGVEIDPGSSLLFLDEVQAAPGMLSRLRWFAEQMPELPVVAAGSLLDVKTKLDPASMPVGRVEYLYVEPMSFPEFLQALGEQRLLDHLSAWRVGTELSPAAHERASDLLRRYAMVGGMPAIVATHAPGGAARRCRQLQQDLVTAFRDDFAKYGGRLDPRILDHALLAVAAMLGRKFVYASMGDGIKQHQGKAAIELLAQARVCHLVAYSTANGIPLGGEVKDTFRKVMLLDVGLLQALLGTPAAVTFPSWDGFADSVRAQIADQLVGQQLRIALGEEVGEPRLFYWQREGGRLGEIDYLIQAAGRIVPIKLNAGAAGAMKSLHQFMFDKHLDLAVRVDSNPPSLQQMDVRTTQSDSVQYRLLNLPHYLVWNVAQLVNQVAPVP